MKETMPNESTDNLGSRHTCDAPVSKDKVNPIEMGTKRDNKEVEG